TEVTYCYEVTNTGSVTFTLHDLEDSELGTLLENFPYTLTPGASAFITDSTTLIEDTTNTATWTAYSSEPYLMLDSDDPGGPEYNFIDIRPTGTPLALSDDGTADLTMPFDFTFYGVTSNQLVVSNNGALVFDAAGVFVGFTNQPLPIADYPLGIFAFWDDLYPPSDGANTVWYETQGSEPNRTFIVQWENVHIVVQNGNTASFQVILYEGSGDVLFQYEDVVFGDPAYDFGASATVGINEDGTSAIQYSYNTPALQDAFAIAFYPQTVLSASDSDSASVNVLAPDIAVDPAALSSTQDPDTVVTQTLTISNTGDADLNWNIIEAPDGVVAQPSVPREPVVVEPMGDPSLSSAGRAPLPPKPLPAAPSGPTAPSLGGGAPVLGFEFVSAQAGFVSFSTDD
ncbi:MAG: hypothetical protein ACRD1H_00705, partial [Vicinamibacterales bacterium]